MARSPRSGRMGRGLGPQVRSGLGDGRCPGVPGSVLGSLWWRELRAEALLTGWSGRGPSTVVERGEKFCLWFFPYVTFLMRESCGRRACSWWRALGVSVLCAGSRPLPHGVCGLARGSGRGPPAGRLKTRCGGGGPALWKRVTRTSQATSPISRRRPSLWPEHCPDGKGPCHTIGTGPVVGATSAASPVLPEVGVSAEPSAAGPWSRLTCACALHPWPGLPAGDTLQRGACSFGREWPRGSSTGQRTGPSPPSGFEEREACGIPSQEPPGLQ